MPVSRRTFLAVSAMGFSGSALGRYRLEDGQQPPVRPTFSSIRGNVGTMIGRGGTIGWLVTGNGNVVVDTQFPDMASICLKFLSQQSKNQELKCVMNTHHHPDHTSGNATMREDARQIVAHQNVPKLLKGAAGGRVEGVAIPDTTFTNEWAIKVGHEEIELRHYGAAHTGGDAVVTFTSANVVHVGDLVFNRRHPIIDRASGGSIASWINVLRRIVADHTPETEYIFGHAAPGASIRGRQADVDRMRDYLLALQSLVVDAIKAGRSRDDLVSSPPAMDGFAEYGPLNDHVLGAAFDEFAAR